MGSERKDVSTHISKFLRNVSSNGSVKRYLALNPQYLAFNHGNTHVLMDNDSNLDLTMIAVLHAMHVSSYVEHFKLFQHK